jgi:hypothetical protein
MNGDAGSGGPGRLSLIHVEYDRTESIMFSHFDAVRGVLMEVSRASTVSAVGMLSPDNFFLSEEENRRDGGYPVQISGITCFGLGHKQFRLDEMVNRSVTKSLERGKHTLTMARRLTYRQFT